MTTTETEPTLYNIPEENWDGLADQITKLNKKAAKVGMPAIRLVIKETVVTKFFKNLVHREMGIESTRTVFVTEVIGEQPKFAGWSFIATLSAVEEMTLVAAVPGVEMDTTWRKADPTNCDHCGTRRNRRETFVLRHDDGTEFQVGRQCLRDFLGHKDPAALAQWATYLIDAAGFVSAAEEGGWGGGRAEEDSWSLRSIFRYTAAVIRADGWLSKTKAMEWGKTPTSATVRRLLVGPVGGPQEQKAWHETAKRIGTPTEQDDADAEATLTFWQQKFGQDELNDYQYNAVVVTRAGKAGGKTFGIACSLLPVAMKELGRVAERAKMNDVTRNSVHVGTEKQRMMLEAEVLMVLPRTTDFGVSTMVKLLSPEGNVFIWWSTRPVDLVIGDKVKGKGTVKSHSEFAGVKQTNLSRCDFTKQEVAK